MSSNQQRAENVRNLRLPSGRAIPILGQGTWGMGEDSAKRKAEIAALRLGLDLGMNLVDTAKMYGEGGAEELVGEVISSRRDDVYLVSKIYPHNATRRGTEEACARSLRRLKTDCLDLYLLHWRGSIPLTETLEAFEALKQAGAIRDYGVSNFDVDDMKEATAAGETNIVTNQVLYNLANRGVEWDLLPWCRGHGIPVMAYSPLESSSIDQRRLLANSRLKAVAARHDATPAQVQLAWLMGQDIVTIPKSATTEHIRENRAAHDLVLNAQDLEELDAAFPPPTGKQPLATK